MRSLPSWSEKLLRAICPEELYEQIEGDLIEIYNYDVKTVGEQKARLRFVFACFRFCRPGILLRNKSSLELNQIPMFQNYFKTTYRHLLRSKVNFTFKLGGLTLALLSFLVIAIYVSYQLSFDRYHEDYENIYRVNSEWRENGEMAKYAIVPTAIGPALKDEFPEVRSFARVGFPSKYQIRYDNKLLRSEGITEVDTSVFDLLTFKFLKGDRHSLNQPNSIVLTESLAKIIFGDEDPLNKSISFVDRSGKTFEVSGIIEDVPSNSHLEIKALLPFEALCDAGEIPMDRWNITIDGSTSLFLRFNDGTKANEFVAKSAPFIRKHLTKHEDDLDKEYAISLTAIKDIYLTPRIYTEFCAKGNIIYVYVFTSLAVFLLAIASINYINLSIADFHKRNKEIGVRKVLGARKKQIVIQIMIDTCFTSFSALILSVGVLYILFPQVLQSLDDNLSFRMLFEPSVLILVAVTMLLLIFFSTAYPAYRLAMNNPINDLKSGSGFGKNSTTARILLLTQFTISILCISATFIVDRQIEFIQTKNPGYERHNMIVVYTPDRFPSEKIPVIKDEFKKLSGVEAVSYSTFRIAGAGYYRDWYRVEIAGEMKQMMLNEVFFDHDFFKATGIPLVAGRSFDPNNSTDSHAAFIVNETAVREFGWDDPIGKRISYGYEEKTGEKWEGRVVGVVKDFNVYSLHKKIEPLVMRLPWSDWPGSCVHIKINGPLDQTIASIKKKYEEILPGFLLDYSVIEEIYDNQYEGEKKAFTTLQLSTWIIVLISSLGIFSLSIYMSGRRMKEFGIRKVLGATANQITFLHVSHFMKIALLANTIALPIAYWSMKEWLNEFAYRTDVSVTLFLTVVMLSFFLVLISAGYSSWKSGRMNPVEVIKAE